MRTACSFVLGEVLANTLGAVNGMIRGLRVSEVPLGVEFDGVLGGIHQTRGHTACLTDGLGQGGDLFFVGKLDIVNAHHLPANGGGDVLGVALAQIPGVWVCRRGKRADNGGFFGVRVDECGDGGATTPGATATTEGTHGAIV